jgi:hypothetical protein
MRAAQMRHAGAAVPPTGRAMLRSVRKHARRGAVVDHYHTWFDLKPGVKDVEFSCAMARYMGELKEKGAIEAWRLTRRKLGFGPKDLGEFHIVMETRDLAQLDAAFTHVATRAEPVESLHQAVNSRVQNLTIALYRDFPDAVRREGEEKF